MQHLRLATLLGLSLVLLPAADRDEAKHIDFNVPREIKLDNQLDAPASAIRIVSWNIDHGSNLGLISKELSDQPSDLLLLQEVDWNDIRSGDLDVAAELGRQLHLNVSYGIEFEELSQEKDHPAYTGQATLCKFPIRRSRVLRFVKQSNFWKPRAWIPAKWAVMQRRLGSRIALVTDLDVNGKLFVVYNAHLESRSAGSIQSKQLDEILADLKSYPAGTSAIIGGDLNSKYFPAGVLHSLEKQGFQSALGQKIRRTHVIMMALDWIFVRGPFQWQQGDVDHSFKGSDHYPISATLRIN